MSTTQTNLTDEERTIQSTNLTDEEKARLALQATFERMREGAIAAKRQKTDEEEPKITYIPAGSERESDDWKWDSESSDEEPTLEQEIEDYIRRHQHHYRHHQQL